MAGLTLLAAAGASATNLADVKGRGSLRVLAVPVSDRDEFFSATGGDAPGFDRELLEGFCNLQRVRLEVVPVSGWDGLIPALRDGKGDVIAGRFTVTESRRKLVDFTSEVFPTRTTVLSRKPHRLIRSLEELRAERVGTIRGTSMAEAVAGARVPRANVDDTIPPGGLPGALKEGKITAAVLGVESVIAAQIRDPEIQIGMFLGSPGSLAYAVRKGETDLLQALDEYIANVRRTQTWSRLVVKYFGEAAPEILRKARTE